MFAIGLVMSFRLVLQSVWCCLQLGFDAVCYHTVGNNFRDVLNHVDDVLKRRSSDFDWRQIGDTEGD